ncbi:MAG TPA: AMP-binding protein [Candidatus Eremiobacteraceae bacterium]|nr:AMP-binding protein [Candidatus Eremiobacteraceae bacterium]
MDESELSRLTLGQLLDRQSAAFGDHACVAYPDRDVHFSYRQFHDRVDLIGRGLMSLGIRKAEHVAVWAPNVPEWLLLQFAIAKIGAILVPIPVDCVQDELEHILRASETTTLFWHEPKTAGAGAMLHAILPGLDDAPVGHGRFETLPRLSRLLVIGRDRLAGMLRFDDLHDLSVQTHPDDYRRRGEASDSFDVVALPFAGDGPGMPKGAMLNHRNLITNGWQAAARAGIDDGDRVCIAVPFSHPLGFVTSSIGSIGRGACMVPLADLESEAATGTIRQMGCSAVVAFPNSLAAIARSASGSTAISAAGKGITGALPVAHELASALGAAFGSGLTFAFGSAEMTSVITQTAAGDDANRRAKTSGKVLPGVLARVVDPHTGNAVAAGSVGELWCRGQGMMKGYYKEPAATSRAIDAEGWYHSPYSATLDRDGYLTLVARREDPIARDGVAIDPGEIESFLRGYPTVTQACAIGVPSKAVGEEVCAVVVTAPGEVASDAEIIGFCRGRLRDACEPTLVMIVEAIPLTAEGAVNRRALRRAAIERFGREEDAAVVTA